MHFQFMIEDQSGAELIGLIMEQLLACHPNTTYSCKAFKGIGGLTKRNTVKETKTGKLLNDLATYLSGFNKSLQGIPAAIVVVLDNDTRDPEAFQRELEDVAVKKAIAVDHVFCIAIEEMEAWLLGDRNALLAAYPSAKLPVLEKYQQDSICGTWEMLADAVYPGGLNRFKIECPTYHERGKFKAEWAREIGAHMDLSANGSPSFQRFLSELKKRLDAE